ncbi:hypothetical protein ANN_10491 [Periplaneta americana]|uniref:Uncharacterized protein n=1 Tax=Periplaneta americana TaxID=6978 RepID=A0ABQ8TRX7_PERAM|nr:hypothetical protein ANN_10491 [Periplaneta americana]
MEDILTPVDRLHVYAIEILNCVDAALVPLHTVARMRLSSYKKCFRVALIVCNGRNKAQLTLVLLPQYISHDFHEGPRTSDRNINAVRYMIKKDIGITYARTRVSSEIDVKYRKGFLSFRFIITCLLNKDPYLRGALIFMGYLRTLSHPPSDAPESEPHVMINDIIKRALISAGFPTILEPNGIHRSNGKHPDGLTLTPWSKGKSLLRMRLVITPSLLLICPKLPNSLDQPLHLL